MCFSQVLLFTLEPELNPVKLNNNVEIGPTLANKLFNNTQFCLGRLVVHMIIMVLRLQCLRYTLVVIGSL